MSGIQKTVEFKTSEPQGGGASVASASLELTKVGTTSIATSKDGFSTPKAKEETIPKIEFNEDVIQDLLKKVASFTSENKLELIEKIKSPLYNADLHEQAEEKKDYISLLNLAKAAILGVENNPVDLKSEPNIAILARQVLLNLLNGNTDEQLPDDAQSISKLVEVASA